jgi:UDP-N-acetylglucosamine:LPS N-acetylglucosamine transferase
VKSTGAALEFGTRILTIVARYNSPGQEEGNIPFVENAAFGKYCGDPAEIATTVCMWLANPDILKSMQEAAQAAARPDATLDIAKDLAAMVFKEKEKQRLLQRELSAAL